jgi:hypothetical protein
MLTASIGRVEEHGGRRISRFLCHMGPVAPERILRNLTYCPGRVDIYLSSALT